MTSTQEGEHLIPPFNQDTLEDDNRGDSINFNHKDETSEQENQQVRDTGLTVLSATVFIVGTTAGSGILALPKALESMGSIGIVLMCVAGFVTAYTGKLLGECWLIVQDRYEEYRGHVRHPYPVMGQVTFGKKGRILVSLCSNFTMFGGSVVFLILGSQNIHGLIQNIMGGHLPFCYIQLIVAGVLLPMCWMNTPKDFWPIAVGAAVATIVASVVLISASVKDRLGPYRNVHTRHSSEDPLEFFQAVAVLIFAFGGHPAFPTFQTDMREPQKFGKAVYIGFSIMAGLYIPVALVCFLVYGAHLNDNVLNTISPGPLLYVVQILITCHLFCGFVIVLNPVLQEVEELLHMPKQFSWKKIIIRSVLVCIVLFVAESIPSFGALLSLLGGSTMALLVCILPPLFFLKLQKMEGAWPKIQTPLHAQVFMIEIIAVGMIVGVISTYGALRRIASPGSLTLPCYLNMSASVV